MNEHNDSKKNQEENVNQETCTALIPVNSKPALPACRNSSCINKNTDNFFMEAGEDLSASPADISEPAFSNSPDDTNEPAFSDSPDDTSEPAFSDSLHDTPEREEPSRKNQNYPFFRHPRKRLTHEQRRRFFKRILKSIAAAIFALFLLAGITVACLIFTAPDLDTIHVSPTESATYIYDQEGNQLRKLTLSSSNRDIVSIEEIPLSLQQAVIAIEDERFYSHGGIDIRGIARAFWNGLKNGGFSEGASTITQQLLKNNVFTEWTQENSFFDRFSRKVQEQYLAVRLEDTMSKEEILENYLNTINLGAGCYGVQAASQRYFGKNVSELTLSEAAVLAAIPQNPTTFNPITSPEKNNSRRGIVLSYMMRQGYITPEEKTTALNDNVYDRIREYDASYEESDIYSYYEDALIDQVLEVLTEEKGYSYDQAYRAVYSGGLRIISAQNQEIQAICDEEFMNAANFPAETKYGIDYALSVADKYGLVTHYGQEDLRSFVRQTYDSSFDLMCQDPATAQTYADAFREYILNSYWQDEADAVTASGDDVSGLSGDNDPDSSGSSGDNSSGGSGSSGDNSSGGSGSSGESSSPEILAERLTLSPQPQASVVIIDQNTGFVQAVVGGRGEKTASLTLNRATETTRQPGSTFKILTAYAPAIDACGQTLATLYDNEPYQYQDGTSVSNWDLSDYSGPTTIRDAIIRSINVVAVKCITEISPQLGYQYALKFGITTLHERYEANGNYSSDLVQPLALGGITQGVTNLELCGAYAAIANSGIYRKPKFFTQIYDRHGNIIVDYTDQQDSAVSDDVLVNTATGGSYDTAPSDGTRILKASTAYLLTDAMQDVVSDESGTAYGSVSAGSCPVAGKTGTTSNYKDIWFVGYTPYYTCSVWGGYDNNENLPDSSTYHIYNKILWSSIMTRIHAALPAASFERPEDITAVTLCSQSRLPAIPDGCPHTYEEVFESGTEPTGECPLHVPVPETEPILIYQDVLDELFPDKETGTEAESSPEDFTENNPESDKPDQSETADEGETIPDTATPPQTGTAPGIGMPEQTGSGTDVSMPGQMGSGTDNNIPGLSGSDIGNNIPGLSGSGTDNSIPGQLGSDTDVSIPGQTENDSGSAIPSQSGSDSGSAGPDQWEDNSGSAIPSQGEADQPQTSSLDDMISQLSKLGLR